MMTFTGIELLAGILGAAIVAGTLGYLFGHERGFEAGWNQCREDE